jgi:hypothetical protein
VTDFNAHTTALVEANVDRTRVGMNWPHGLAQLIEAHEKKHHGLVTRKQIHVLIDRYIERYFPGQVVEYAHRHEIIALLRRRYFDRSKVYLHEYIRRRKRVVAATAVGLYGERMLVSEDWPSKTILRPPGGWKFEH